MRVIPILTHEESRAVDRCLTCDKPLDKAHFRLMYCSRLCRNRAHRSRKAAKASHARMTPELYRKLQELRQASRTEIEIRSYHGTR